MKIVGVLSGSILCMAAPAFAQSNSAEKGEPTAGDIVVTARTDNPVSVGKTEERLLESPQSVSVVDRGFIAAINTKTVAESLSYTPGIQVTDNAFNRTSDTATIRGFNLNSATGGILLDGMKPQAADAMSGARKRSSSRPPKLVSTRTMPGVGVSTISKSSALSTE